jgi:iron complex outermembrane receptor protein
MKSSTKVLKFNERNSHFNRGCSRISVSTEPLKPVIRGLSGNRVLVYSQGVSNENQQFGDEHGFGLNDSG